MKNVKTPSVGFQVFKPIRESTREKNHTNVRHVGRASVVIHQMDKIDAAILNELRKNARIANRTLAQKVHLSPSAVLARMNKLKRTGIIKSFETRLDGAKLGLGLTVIVALSLEKNIGDRRIGEELAKFPEVIEIHDVAGECDYL